MTGGVFGRMGANTSPVGVAVAIGVGVLLGETVTVGVGVRDGVDV